MVGIGCQGDPAGVLISPGITRIPLGPQAGTQGDLSPWDYGPSVPLQGLDLPDLPPVWCQAWRRNPAWRWPGQLLADHCEDSRGWYAVAEDWEGIVRDM